MSPPGLDDVAEVRRLHIAVRAVLRDSDPGLGAAGPDMPDRKEPAGVVETTRFHDGDLGIGARLVKQPGTALRADDAVNHTATLVLAFPHSGLAFLDNDSASVGKQRKAEGCLLYTSDAADD